MEECTRYSPIVIDIFGGYAESIRSVVVYTSGQHQRSPRARRYPQYRRSSRDLSCIGMASVSNGSGQRRAASVLHFHVGGDWPDDVVPDEEDGDSPLMLIDHTFCAPGGALSCALRSRRHIVDWAYSQVRDPRLQFALATSISQVYDLDVQGGVWGPAVQIYSAIGGKE